MAMIDKRDVEGVVAGVESDPLYSLNYVRMQQLIGVIPEGPLIWIIGDSWVEHDGNHWWIDAHEKATDDQVRDLLIRANGKAELQGYQ